MVNGLLKSQLVKAEGNLCVNGFLVNNQRKAVREVWDVVSKREDSQRGTDVYERLWKILTFTDVLFTLKRQGNM